MTARAIIDKYSPAFVRQLVERIEASPLGGRLACGAFWSLSGSLISRGLGLISAILVGRILGKLGFGEMGIIQNTIGMFGVLAGFGMSVTANKHVAEFKKTDPERAGRILAMSAAVAWIASGVMAVILYAAAPWVAEKMLAAAHLTPLLRISALLLFLSGINGAQGGALGGFEAFKVLARIGLWTGLMTFPVSLIGAMYFGLTGAVWGLVISQGINCILNHLAVRREAAACGIHSTLTGAASEASLFWKFSLPAVMTGLVSNFAAWAGSVLVVHQSEGYSQMGVYNAVMRVKAVPELLLAMLLAPVIPILSEAFGRRDYQTYRRTLLSCFLLAIAVIIPVSLLQTAAPDLTLMLYGPEYRGHPELMQWLMLHSVSYALLYPLGSVLISTGSMWLAWTLSALYSLIYIGTAWILVPRYGVTGFAACMTISYVLANIPSVWILFQRHADVMRSLKLGRLSTVSALAFAGSYFASLHLPLGPAVVAGGAISLTFLLWEFWFYRHRAHP